MSVMTASCITPAESWAELRQQAAEHFAREGFPSRKEEAWKYTRLRDVSDAQLTAAEQGREAAAQPGWVAEPLVLVDGYPQSQPTLPEGVSLEVMDLDNLSDAQQALLMEHLAADTLFEKAGHVALNRAQAKQALVIRVSASPTGRGRRDQAPQGAPDDAGEGNKSAEGVKVLKCSENSPNTSTPQHPNTPAHPHPKSAVQISTPDQVRGRLSPSGRGVENSLEIHHIPQAADAGSFTPVILLLEAGAELTLVERFYGDVAVQHLQNQVSNIVLQEGAKLTHIRSQQLPEGVTHLYSAQVACHADSRYEGFSLMAGASTARQEVQMHLLGDGAHADMQGVVLGQGNQHVDSYLPVYHDAPGCYSSQHIRQLLDDASSGVYYGRAEVPTTSPRTEAHQLNKNLLLSDAAQVYTRPELDILTDEVVCSHGATTGSLDEEALYYLQARGIPFAQARAMLTRGFIEELLQAVPVDAAREGLREEIDTSRHSRAGLGDGVNKDGEAE